MTTRPAFALFDTAIGRLGIVWGERGVVGVQLPESDESQTRARIHKLFPAADQAPPSPAARCAIEGIAALLNGQPSDLSAVELDMDRVPAFHRRVYQVARRIPPGQTSTYGEIATRLGDLGLAQAVGRSLARNPFPIVVPCHRVLAANGRIGGFSAPGGVSTKLRLLSIEGADTLF